MLHGLTWSGMLFVFDEDVTPMSAFGSALAVLLVNEHDYECVLLTYWGSQGSAEAGCSHCQVVGLIGRQFRQTQYRPPTFT